jgi:hypothetical protein
VIEVRKEKRWICHWMKRPSKYAMQEQKEDSTRGSFQTGPEVMMLFLGLDRHTWTVLAILQKIP